MSEPGPSTGRVRVTNPLTVAAPHVRRPVAQEIDEATGLGEAYTRSLVRSQLRLALAVVLTLLLTLGPLPVVLAVADDVELLGVPLAWAVLGVGVYPGLLLLGWLYLRQSERAERDFASLVERS